MTTLAVFRVLPDASDSYPRLLPSHPRNRGVDWVELGKYAEEGQPEAHRFDIFVKAKGEFDTVWIAGRTGYLFSDRLRRVLEPLAGGPVEFLPVTVNGQPFWVMRLKHVIDALDLARSQYDASVDGGIRLLNVPVWRGECLTDPALFSIPQLRHKVWATPTVVEAYKESGCNGLLFSPQGEVV
jgi:hypothetical protein